MTTSLVVSPELLRSKQAFILCTSEQRLVSAWGQQVNTLELSQEDKNTKNGHLHTSSASSPEHNLIKHKEHMTALQSFCQSDTFHDSFSISLLQATLGMLQVGGKGTFLIKSLNLCSDFRSQSSFSEIFQEDI